MNERKFRQQAATEIITTNIERMSKVANLKLGDLELVGVVCGQVKVKIYEEYGEMKRRDLTTEQWVLRKTLQVAAKQRSQAVSNDFSLLQNGVDSKILTALLNLDDSAQDLLILNMIERFPLAEVALILGKTEKEVTLESSKALKQLSVELKQSYSSNPVQLGPTGLATKALLT